MLLGYKIVDKYSNWNYYCVGSEKFAKKADDERILELISNVMKLLKNPYLRFMYTSKYNEAACVVCDNGRHVTKLVSLSEVEQMVKEGKFHK